MGRIEEYPCETLTANVSADINVLMDVTGAGTSGVTDVEIILGSEFDSTFDVRHGGAYRFEIDIPEGATITGVRLQIYGSGGGNAGGPMPLSGGFLKRQENANSWEDDSAFAEWTLDTHHALPEYGDGGLPTEEVVTLDPTVWWGDAPGFEDVSMGLVGLFASFDIGEGTLPPRTDGGGEVVGLVSQLQRYLDDPENKKTRGATKVNSIPVALLIHRHHEGDRDQYQYTHSTDGPNAAFHPKLLVEWEIRAGEGSIINRPRLTLNFT